MYARFTKRLLDVVLSFFSLILLSPLLVLLTVLGAVIMKGNPFFVQKRPGKIGKDGKEKIFSLIKFRTMNNKRDADGNLLPDKDRLNGYGRFLRETSLDELCELINCLKGDMSLVGPRPLLIEYLPYYTPVERRRHTVRPGITGLAQVSGRNALSWDRRFAEDVKYVDNISFSLDSKIVFKTVKNVLARSGVADDTRETEGNFAEIRAKNNNTYINK